MIYAYVRVSTDRQDNENQKIGISAKATAMGMEIDEWIADDGVSGAKEANKRNLGPLLDKLKKGDVVIASEISRLGRKLFMIMRILEHCMNVEAKVYTVKDGYELGDNIQSKVLAFAFGLAAEIERDMIQKRTKEGLARRRQQGVILGRRAGSGGNPVALAGREEIVSQYMEAGLNYSQIARILKVHRITVSSLAATNGWAAPVVFKGEAKKNISQVHMRFSVDQIEELKSLVDREPSASTISRHFEEKHGIIIKTSQLIKYFKDLNIYCTYVATNARERAVFNTECGKNKR